VIEQNLMNNTDELKDNQGLIASRFEKSTDSREEMADRNQYFESLKSGLPVG